MKFMSKAAVAAVAAGVCAAPAVAQQSGPVAVYWVSASTTAGMAGMMGGGAPGGGGGKPAKRPGLGAMMGAALGGGLPGMGGGGGGRGGRGGAPQYVHSLTLQLGSTQKAAGEPAADHLVPEGLGAGPSLPLLSPRVAPPEPREDAMPPQMGEMPRGKIKIYWGCGEHAAGPPIVIDFANLGKGAMSSMPMIAANPGRPPSAGRFASYGEWPNERARTSVPPQGSLVGAHTVQGNYSPPISFNLGPDHDFMAPLNITSQEPSPGGGTRITWNPVPGTTGYFAWMMGGGGGGRGDDVQAVMWSSSGTAAFMGAVMDYLPPSEVRRLVASRVVLPPSATECIIPSEVIEQGAVGMLSMIAYGDEVNLADPPKPANPKTPWNLKWTVKVRYKSTTGVILGMPNMGGY